MNICKHILIAALTFSLITQSFASQTARAMEVVRSNYTDRMNAYNALPTDAKIPNYSGTLNQLFAKGPNREPVRAEHLKEIQAQVLKAVMGTALIHGDNMLLAAHGIDPRNTSEFRHHEILRITQELSQTVAGQIIDNDFSAIDNIGDFQDIGLLKTYGGIEVDELKTWFTEVYSAHTGLLRRDGTGTHWRNPASYPKQKPAVSFNDDPALKRAMSASLETEAKKTEDLKPFIQFTTPNGQTMDFEHYHIPGTGDCGFLAIAVETYFTQGAQHNRSEDQQLRNMLSGDLQESTVSNTSYKRLLSDEEIESLFSISPNAAAKEASIKKKVTPQVPLEN